jgi:hypothetical protein
MCFWPFLSYIHATSTTDAHPKKRRKHKYSKRCSQCFKKLDDNTRVAAHVVAYPCFCLNCCFGILTLKTTCKKCNSQNKAGKKKVDRQGWFCLKTIFTNEYILKTKLKYVVYPCCLHYKLK